MFIVLYPLSVEMQLFLVHGEPVESSVLSSTILRQAQDERYILKPADVWSRV